MKTIFTSAVFMLVFLGWGISQVTACPGEELPGKNEAARSASVCHVRIDNKANQNRKVDSVWVVFDRYDLTGAGVIRKVFYPDAENRIEINDVPEGKYYATIITLGTERKQFEKIIEVKKPKAGKKRKELVLSLPYSPVYKPGEFIPPPEDTRRFSYVHF